MADGVIQSLFIRSKSRDGLMMKTEELVVSSSKELIVMRIEDIIYTRFRSIDTGCDMVVSGLTLKDLLRGIKINDMVIGIPYLRSSGNALEFSNKTRGDFQKVFSKPRCGFVAVPEGNGIIMAGDKIFVL